MALDQIPVIGGFLNQATGGGAPDPTTVQLDPGTQALENQQATMAGQPSSYYTGILNRGVDGAGQLAQSSARANQSAAGLGMDPNQFQAIRRVYAGHAEQGINQLKNQNDMQGQLMKADYMNTISKAMLNQQAQAVNQYQFLTNAYMQQEQARAQTVNSLFQVGDQVIGMNAKMKGANTQAPMAPIDTSNARTYSGMDYNLDSNYGQYGGTA